MKQFYTFILCFSTSLLMAQITLVKDINDGTSGSNPRNLFIFNGNIYFNADDSSGVNSGGSDTGQELWVSDGTDAGTNLVKDIRSGSGSSSPNFFFELGGTLYFLANDGGGGRIWQTDGTDAGTVSTNNGFSNVNPIVIGSKAYMTATTMGNTFYEFDGTTFQQVPDAGSGTATPIGGIYIELDSNTILLYMDYSTDEATIGRELYKYDIATQTYTLVKDIDTGTGDSGISHIAKVNSTVFLEADNALWQTDGTESGTILVSTVDNAGIAGLSNFYSWNNKLFFEGDDGNGDQLWVYDPSADTVTNISNIGGTNATHDPSDYVAYNGWLYYSGEDADDNSQHLFRTNGTIVEQLDNTIIDVDDLVVLNDKLYFEGDNGTDGNELYVLDLTTLSTDQGFSDTGIAIYPNPSNTFINIQGSFTEAANYSVIDTNGKIVLKGSLQNRKINHSLAPGVYFLQLTSLNKVINRKIIVR